MMLDQLVDTKGVETNKLGDFEAIVRLRFNGEGSKEYRWPSDVI